ncbi:MAG: acyl-CoA thioesterase [Pirellulaceae bacterium]|nr:acyl-CoA thioesterase [Pirellulaceae bacterium]
MQRDEFCFFHRLRVRWAEVDRQDVVFNGNYFLYFDVAVTEYWRTIGVSYPHGYVDRFGQDIFAVKATAEFHAALSFDDEVDVGCRVSKLGRTSLIFTLGIWKGSLQTTSGQLVYVNVLVANNRPTPWPESLVQSITTFERTPPTTA